MAPHRAPLSDPAPATHLELRLGELYAPRGRKRTTTGPSTYDSRPTAAAEPDRLDALLDSGRLSPIQTLSLVLSGAPIGSEAARLLSTLIKRLPALQTLTVCSTGSHDYRQHSPILELHERCGRDGLRFAVDFILDSEADACATLSRKPTSLAPVRDVSRALRIKGVNVRWSVPALPALVYRLESLFSLARHERIDPLLIPAWMLRPMLEVPYQTLTPDEELFLRDFISYRLLGEERLLVSPERVGFYQALHDSLGGSGPRVPTTVCSVAVLAIVEGDAVGSWALRYEDRPSFEAARDDGASHWPEPFERTRAGLAIAQAVEVVGVLSEGIRGLLQWMAASATRPLLPFHGTAPGTRFPTVLVIGAYGGEHIGDAAILGGVLLRLYRRYGTTRAILMSQRALHTHHLVCMLDTPVEVIVEAYEQSRVRERLRQVDAVIFAGGPLIDLPKQLVKHLYTVSLARRRNKPFIVEGIGAGPFLRWPSEWTARRLVRMADRVSVRTFTDSEVRLVRDLNPEVSRDPAFDYLASRRADLMRLPQVDRRWIESLLRDTDGRVTIGINVRPIRPDYTVGISPQKRIEYTRFVEARFEERLAEGIRRFSSTASRPPCFVFYPMNAIQFGLSDLRSAYRIQRLLGKDVDMRVWEGDPSIDGVISLLRRLDLVISMRFHATIFALALERRVIGIDYRVGTRDKVAALLSDFGQSENCCRIDQMTVEWLLQRLSALSGSPHEI